MTTPTYADDFLPILESTMRITLAGFGGAMAGLSMSRRGGLRAASSLASKTVESPVSGTLAGKKHLIRRHHPTMTSTVSNAVSSSTSSSVNSHAVIDKELPVAWSVACMAFAGMVEFARFVSPAGFAHNWISRRSILDENADGGDVTGAESWIPQIPAEFQSLYNRVAPSSFITMGDYMIGGSIAGAIFRGAAVRTRSGRMIDSSITRNAGGINHLLRATPLSGVLPGAALGLMAGVFIVAVDFVNNVLNEHYGAPDAGPVDDDPRQQDEFQNSNNGDEVPAHIKAMSNEELMKSIDELKRPKNGRQ